MNNLSEQFEAQQRSKELARRSSRLGNLNLKVIGLIASAAIILVIIVVVAIPSLIPTSPEELYDEDHYVISEAILVVSSGYSPKPITQSSGSMAEGASKKDSYSTKARAKLGIANALKLGDAGSEEITVLLGLESHPGKAANQVGTPVWEDVDGDGIRIPENDKLFYHNAPLAPTEDHWNTTAISANNTDYLVDSRDWFIDMDLLVKGEYLDEIPASASPDNSTEGTGSYSWYVNESFEVKSMLYTRPTIDTDGFQQVYP